MLVPDEAEAFTGKDAVTVPFVVSMICTLRLREALSLTLYLPSRLGIFVAWRPNANDSTLTFTTDCALESWPSAAASPAARPDFANSCSLRISASASARRVTSSNLRPFRMAFSIESMRLDSITGLSALRGKRVAHRKVRHGNAILRKRFGHGGSRSEQTGGGQPRLP